MIRLKHLLHKTALRLLFSVGQILPDRFYLSILFRLKTGNRLHLRNPQTFNEKMQWLKLYNRRPLFTRMVDKLEAKNIAADIIGEQHIIPTLNVWKRVDDIDFDSLPQQFVLKTTHSGGNTGIIICEDKSSLNINSAKQKLQCSLKSSIYRTFREWPYKNVLPQIIAEKYLTDGNQGMLKDYKFYCFNGKADSVMVCQGREKGAAQYYFFSRDWQLLPINYCGTNVGSDFTIERPENLSEMFDIAEKLAAGFPFIRIDLFSVDKTIYFGEFTFFPASGMGHNILPATDKEFGSRISLPQKNIESK